MITLLKAIAGEIGLFRDAEYHQPRTVDYWLTVYHCSNCDYIQEFNFNLCSKCGETEFKKEELAGRKIWYGNHRYTYEAKNKKKIVKSPYIDKVMEM